MDNKFPQYQRAVTPTIEGSTVNGSIKGKVLAYNSTSTRNKPKTININNTIITPTDKLYTNANATSLLNTVKTIASPRTSYGNSSINSGANGLLDMNIQGKSSKGNYLSSPTATSTAGIATTGIALATNSNSNSNSGNNNNHTINNPSNSNSNNINYSIEQLSSLSVLPRYDLLPLTDELPTDGIIFARIRNNLDSLVVFRTPEERLRNPERLNLDRRQLEICPLLEQEQRLRLLNYQNNHIKVITNLENLPNLIFLDLYNNNITTLNGSLCFVKGLRVLMAGKNKISKITNLELLKKLDVLDLHSNDIKCIEGLNGLTDLRVLNLAGNKISVVDNLSSLTSLTELNLRRNNIEIVTGLQLLPSLQRVFLSHNSIECINSISCLFEVKLLIELSLDGNPIADSDHGKYRNEIIASIPGLRHLDLKRITEDERKAAISYRTKLAETVRQEKAWQEKYELQQLLQQQQQSTELQYNRNNNLTIDLPILLSSIDDEVSKKLTSPKNNMKPYGTIDYNGIEGEGKILATKGNVQSKYNSDANMCVTISNNTDGNNYSNSQSHSHFNSNKSPTNRVSLTEFARAGNLSAAKHLFDLEIIGPSEKALIAVGDTWEWTQSRRLLANVSEVILLHIRKESINQKFLSLNSPMPSLKTLRFFANDFTALAQLHSIADWFGDKITNLYINDNPICTNSQNILRSYVIAIFPNLQVFNGQDINDNERSKCEKMFKALLIKNKSMSSHYNTVNKVKTRDQSIETAFYSCHGNVKIREDADKGINNGLYSVGTDFSSMKKEFSLSFDNVIKDLIENSLNIVTDKPHK